MSSVGYHEPVEELSADTRDMHRAIVSLMEELEAVDWYNQRTDACKDTDSRQSSRTIGTRKKSMPPCCWSGFGAKTPGFPRNSRTTCSPKNRLRISENA